MVKNYPKNWAFILLWQAYDNPMPRKRRLHMLVEDGIYHVIARGNHKKPLFYEETDYFFFKKHLAEYKIKYSIEVLAYCLMSNHYHLLLKSGLQLPKLMHAFSIKYVKYFNAKYGLRGHLFEDRYKSFLVADDPYMITLIRYIHNNPVRAGLVDGASLYSHSSLVDYANGNMKGLTDIKAVNAFFDNNSKVESIALVLA